MLAGEKLSYGVEAFEWVVESGVRERGEKIKSMRYAWRRTSTPRAAVENARVRWEPKMELCQVYSILNNSNGVPKGERANGVHGMPM